MIERVSGLFWIDVGKAIETETEEVVAALMWSDVIVPATANEILGAILEEAEKIWAQVKRKSDPFPMHEGGR